MNIWSGDFPDMNDGADGWKFLAPVRSAEKDKMGLFHLKGNVWEWCEDIYHFEIHDKLAFKKKRSQKAYIEQGYDIGNNENAQDYRVIKGGSYLCHKSYCAGYRPEARQKAKFNETFAHIGFRIVKDIK